MNDASDVLDAELAKARLGDRAALAALVQTHQRSVYSLALRMLGTRDLAEDLTQDVFMQLGANLAGIASNKHLGFWLRRVTSNRAIDQLRHRSLLQMSPLEDDATFFSAEQEPDPLLQRLLQGLIARLSPPARAVLLLRYQEDLDPADIARTLDMPINTVKSHLKRSLEIMRAEAGGIPPERCEGNSR